MSPPAQVADRYVIEEELGIGGMARVWRGHDPALDRPVVVKRLHPHLGADPAASARFRQEALAAASLAHPGVVSVYDAGEDEEGPFLVMELVEGETLASLLARQGRLPPERGVRIAVEAADALQAAHDRGIIHRDVKPSNILLDETGRAKVTDFGIARIAHAPDRFTETGTVLGTAAYMAPEVAAGEEPTPASDVYSLGVVLYQTLTGRPPFDGSNALAVLAAHQNQAPEPPGRLADLPGALEAVVLRALEKDPRRRFASAAALARGLETGEGEPTLAVRPPRSPSVATARLPARERPGAARWRWEPAAPAVAGVLRAAATSLREAFADWHRRLFEWSITPSSLQVRRPDLLVAAGVVGALALVLVLSGGFGEVEEPAPTTTSTSTTSTTTVPAPGGGPEPGGPPDHAEDRGRGQGPPEGRGGGEGGDG